jgi:hypothetical protein
MNRFTTTAAILGAAALTLSLAACGGSDGYCDLLEESGSALMNASSFSDPDAAANVAGTIREIADAAPNDIADDWRAMADAMETLADLDMSDPEALSQLDELGDLAGISGRVQQHAISECG